MGFNGIAKSQVLLPFVTFDCLVRPVGILSNFNWMEPATQPAISTNFHDTQLFTWLMTDDWWLVCASLQQEQRGEESEFCPELATAGQWIVLWQPFCLIWFYDSICAVWLAGRCSSNLFVWYLILSVLSSSSSSALTTLLSDTTMILSVLSWWLDGALATFLSDSTSLILLWFYLCCIGEWTVLWQQSWQPDPTLRIICA